MDNTSVEFARLRRKSRVTAVAALFGVLLASGAAGAAERASVDAAAAEGFGRIVLTFADRQPVPPYEARIVNGVMVLGFDRAIEADVAEVPLALPGFMSVARQDPDGSGLRFGLARGVTVNTQLAGERLFIDLLPPGWRGLPPGLPEEVVAELAARAEEAAKAARRAAQLAAGETKQAELNLRIGRGPTFTRIAFHWNLPFDADFSRKGERLEIAFNHPAAADLAAIRANLPPLLRTIEAVDVGEDEGARFVLTVERGAEIRAFRGENSYVLDLTSDALKASAYQALDEIAPALAETEGGSEIVTVLPPDDASAGEAAAIGAVATSIGVVGDAPSARTAPAEDPTAEAPQSQAALAVPAAPAEGPPPLRVADRTVLPAVSHVGSATRIVLPLAEPAAAAAFQRGQVLWVVLDTAQAVVAEPIAAAFGPAATLVTVERAGGATVIRATLAGRKLAAIEPQGSGWVVTLGDSLPALPQTLALERRAGADGALRLEVPFAHAGAVHRLRDPVIGDEIVVVTGGGPARALLNVQRFVELEVLASLHGIALVPLADDVTAAIAGDAVMIGRGRGLALSTRTAAAGAGTATPPDRPGFVDLRRWAAVPADDYRTTLAAMQAAVAAAEGAERPAARMDLARLYLSRRCGPESLGLLRLAAEEDPALLSNAGFRMTRIAAEVTSGRYQQALQDLADGAFAEGPDAALWRTFAAAGAGRWETVAEAAPLAAAVTEDYPEDLRADYHLAVAEAAIEAGNLSAAETALAALDRLPPPAAAGVAKRDMLLGRTAEAAGDPTEAVRAYQAAIATDVRSVASEAQFRMTRLQHENGAMSAEAARAALEGLSVAWRGDDTEIRTLRLLARLQVDDRQYRDAFLSMKAALAAHSGSRLTAGVQDDLAGVFADLFLEGGADALPPVTALGLFYDFRDLTPVGRRGDEMVRLLADRLVQVDLLDQAAGLLKHQVENRLRGAGRAQVAADLAVVYLLARKPQEALQVLRRTDQAELPSLLDRQRRFVEARALSDSGDAKAAIELLASMEGTEVERLRAETLWAAGEWQGAAEQAERMLGERWRENLPLTAAERREVLRGAIGYTMADDALGSARLRGKYQAQMADSPDARAFEVVTRAVESDGVAFREVVRDLAGLDPLGAFLADYRSRYPAGSTATAAALDPAPDPETTAGI